MIKRDASGRRGIAKVRRARNKLPELSTTNASGDVNPLEMSVVIVCVAGDPFLTTLFAESAM